MVGEGNEHCRLKGQAKFPVWARNASQADRAQSRLQEATVLPKQCSTFQLAPASEPNCMQWGTLAHPPTHRRDGGILALAALEAHHPEGTHWPHAAQKSME